MSSQSTERYAAFRGRPRPEGYCIIATCHPVTGKMRPLAKKGMVVLFDTVTIAQQFAPLLGAGRTHVWTGDGETCWFLPLGDPHWDQVQIGTGYDPYSVPVNHLPGVSSERKNREWKHHIMWNFAFYDAGQISKNPDGSSVNTALPELEIFQGLPPADFEHSSTNKRYRG